MASFKELGLPSCALRAVEALGYTTPTPVQEQAIPEILAGQDVIAAASTGTGKTAAFLLPTLSKLEAREHTARAPRILVITPTRELAEQIAYASMRIGRCCGHYTAAQFGGKPIAEQIEKLAGGCDIAIATPGRLCDLIDKRAIDLDSIDVLVLDEADRMLDMGFLPDVRRIVNELPRKRQTLLFSATIDRSIQDNFLDLLDHPRLVQISKRGETAKKVKQFMIPVSPKEKLSLLKCVLAEKGSERVIVFARTKARVEDLAHALREADIEVETIHSDKTQGQRKHALNEFRKGRVGIIIATDVLARGIDIPEVDYVINYDLPDMLEDYIHRIGRTGRAGVDGFAVSFVTRDSLAQMRDIEALVKCRIPLMRLDSFEIDPSILDAPSRRARAKGEQDGEHKPRKQRRSLHKDVRYNYSGWGDKRTGAKKRTYGSKEDAKGDERRPGKQKGRVASSPKRKNVRNRRKGN